MSLSDQFAAAATEEARGRARRTVLALRGQAQTLATGAPDVPGVVAAMRTVAEANATVLALVPALSPTAGDMAALAAAQTAGGNLQLVFARDMQPTMLALAAPAVTVPADIAGMTAQERADALAALDLGFAFARPTIPQSVRDAAAALVAALDAVVA